MIGLILPCNLKYAPYAQYYIDVLRKEGIDYEILSWNKKDIDEDCEHVFRYCIPDGHNILKLLGHFRFSRFVRQIVSKRKYSELIVFTVTPLFFLSSLLTGKYKGRFIVDVRDACPLVKRFPTWFDKIISCASKIVVSSPNFSEWIPYEVNMCHNCSVDILGEHRNDEIFSSKDLPIKISCAGSMNEGDINIRFIDAAQNGDVFQHCYIGVESSEKRKIMSHVSDKKYSNVKFMGTYKKEDIVSIYHETADFVNIIRREMKVNADALPNKLYDAVVSGKPVIVLVHNTAIVKLVSKYNLGVIVNQEDLDDPEHLLLPRLLDFSYDDYKKGRIAFIDDVIADQIKFSSIVKDLR